MSIAEIYLIIFSVKPRILIKSLYLKIILLEKLKRALEIMQYLYYLANVSLTLRVVEYFSKNNLSVEFVTVINQLHGWIINIKMKSFVSVQKDKDIRAFLSEMGIIYSPSELISKVLSSLEAGQSAINVMEHYHVAIVSHGRPQPDEIEAFRQNYIRGLGYCPQNLA